MRQFNNTLILGLGAVGSTLASQLYDNSYDFSVLCDKSRLKRYQKDNFIINSKKYIFNYVSQETYNKKADFVIIATKYNQLREAIALLDGLLSDDCVIMSLLNGIDSEVVIGEMYGMEKMVYAFISGTDSTKIGNVNTYHQSGIITYGEKDGSITDRAKKIAKEFDDNSVKYNLTTTIIDEQWWKYMLNIGMNQVSAVLRAPYGIFNSCSEIAQLNIDSMNEAVLIARAKGINLNNESIQRVINMLTTLNENGMTSMLQDVLAKRITEVDMFAGKLIKLGEELGIATPINRVLYQQIKTIESMY